MTLIQELLGDLAPEGLKYVRLAEIAEVGTGSSNRNESSFSGQYPLFVRSKTIYRSDDFEFDEAAIVIPGEGGVGEIFHYVDGKYALHQRAYRIRIRDNSVDTKFVLYFMKSHFKKFILMKAVSATVTSIRKPMILEFRIPVPPLQVQQRIVEILDTFSSLEAELEAELEARKKQYEFYRNQLLTFPEQGGVRWVPMGEVVTIVRPPKVINRNDYQVSGSYPIIDQGQSTIAGWTSDSDSLLPMAEYVLFGDHTRTTKFVDREFAQGADGLQILKAKNWILPKFLFYTLQNLEIPNRGYNRHWSIVKPTKVPVPAIETQREIIEILDKFYSLVNDIAIGLPAELNARRKQYEYYRNKLLTFKELQGL